MEQPPSRMLSRQEIAEIRSRCTSLNEHAEPTPQLLACLAHWRQQSEQQSPTMTTEEGT